MSKKRHFQRQFLQRWSTSKQCCEYDQCKKKETKIKPRVKNKIIFFELQRIQWT